MGLLNVEWYIYMIYIYIETEKSDEAKAEPVDESK